MGISAFISISGLELLHAMKGDEIGVLTILRMVITGSAENSKILPVHRHAGAIAGMTTRWPAATRLARSVTKKPSR
jgi:hypothetical protein